MSGLLIQAVVGSSGGTGELADEPLGVARVGSLEDAGALVVELLRVAVVDGGWGHQPDPGVAVGVVVPVDERPAVPARVLDRVEPGLTGSGRPLVAALGRGCRTNQSITRCINWSVG